MKKILVAGGVGFVGSHLCEKLIKDGHDIYCMDNYYTSSKSNVSHLLSNPNFHLIECDITRSIPFYTNFDEIYNLACPASPIHYQKDPVHTIKTNVIGTLNLLELAKESHATFLQASTSEIYGDPIVHPQVESYWGNVNPVGPRSCYDEGKRCAETLCTDFARQEGVKVCIIRIFNTYGPKMHPNDGRVVSNLIIQALKGEDLTIYGDGLQTRSFQYVTDLIRGMTTVMEKKYAGPVNLGNPDEFTMIELAKMICELTGSISKIIFQPLPKDDPRQRRPDISLAKRDLDWEPRVKLIDGLIQTIDYFRSVSEV